MGRDPYGHGESVPLWAVVLVLLALAGALLVGASMAHANPASTNVFLGRGATPVVFRAKTTGSGTTVTVPAGAAVGDLAVVVTSQSNLGSVTITSGGGAWSSINVNGGGTNCGGAACLSILNWKVLVLADLSGSWTVNQSIPYTALDYVGNGATTLALRETKSNYGGSSLTFTGYTPVYATRGALSVLFTTNAITPTVPTGFTLRDATTGAGAFNTPNSADLLNYQSGGPVWTSLGVVGGYGGLLEFSGP